MTSEQAEVSWQAAAADTWQAIAEQRDRELRLLGERKYLVEQERDALREERDALLAELVRMEARIEDLSGGDAVRLAEGEGSNRRGGEVNRPYSEATAAMIAEAMHKALDAVDEGWHLSCMDTDGDGSCAKGHYARRMLVEDVAPAVLDALIKAGLLLCGCRFGFVCDYHRLDANERWVFDYLRRAAGHDETRWDVAARDVVARVRTQAAEDLWREAQRLRAEDYPTKIAIEYVWGFEGAAGWLERRAGDAESVEEA
jgi:hypothetical protein